MYKMGTVPPLPNEILLRIALTSPETYRQMLALPPVARMSIGSPRRYILRNFTMVKNTKRHIAYYVGKWVHRDDGPALIRKDGSKYWYREGRLHREDGPAIEFSDGREKWYKWGTIHRDDGPAIIHPKISEEWYREGKLHRDDGPAYTSNRETEWYREGKLHRESNLPARITKYRSEWYRNGVLHRDIGPAVEVADGTKIWYRKGKLHRYGDLPAVEYADGSTAWYQYGALQRVNGPAIVYINGGSPNVISRYPKLVKYWQKFPSGCYWYVRNHLHRMFGPAVQTKKGNEWWLHCVYYGSGITGYVFGMIVSLYLVLKECIINFRV